MPNSRYQSVPTCSKNVMRLCGRYRGRVLCSAAAVLLLVIGSVIAGVPAKRSDAWSQTATEPTTGNGPLELLDSFFNLDIQFALVIADTKSGKLKGRALYNAVYDLSARKEALIDRWFSGSHLYGVPANIVIFDFD